MNHILAISYALMAGFLCALVRHWLVTRARWRAIVRAHEQHHERYVTLERVLNDRARSK